MQELLRILAEWKGIPADGMELQFEFASFPSGGLGLLVLLLLVLMATLVVAVYRKDGRTLAPWQRALLATLRVLAVLVAAAALLEPNLVAVRRDVRPGAVILLADTSQSMNQTDPFRRQEAAQRAQAWRDVGVVDPSSATRLDLLKALLAHEDGAFVRKLAAKNEPKLHGYAAGLTELPLVPASSADGAAAAPRIDLDALVADGRGTNLGGALRAALDKSRTAEIAAVVVLGDGRRNAGPLGAEIARMLNQRKAPRVFVLGVGDPSATQTVAIASLQAPAKVFQKDPFELKATVAASGYEATTVGVRLVRVDERGAEQVVRTQDLAVGGDVAQAAVQWSDLASEETGRFVYRLELTPPGGEPPAPERHMQSAAIEVLGERTRVLLLSGGASHEYQILRNLLIRDQTIDVSCWLQSADPEFPQDGDEGVRIDALPADRAQLEPYDVVITIDPDSRKLPAGFAEALRLHVLEDGCGLWWVAGEKFSIEAFRDGAATRPLVELLPIVPDLRHAESVANLGLGLAHVQANPYSLAPDGEEGAASKAVRIAPTRQDCRLLWPQLPGFHVAFPVQRPKPAAAVLVRHDNADPRLKQGGEGMPLIAAHSVGAGRVLWSGADETYRWRSVFEDAYDRYWVMGVRYLYEGRIHAGNSRVELLVSDQKVELGDALTVTVAAKDEQYQPLLLPMVDLAIERDGQPAETLQAAAVAEAPGAYQLQWRPAQTGSYRLRTLGLGGKSVEQPVQVVPAQVETEGPVDEAELAAIAACNGGVLCATPTELLAALDEIPSRSATDTYRTPHALWDGWATVALVLCALTLEWLLRKRFNLL